MSREMPPRPAALCFDDWAGRHERAVVVVGETAAKYRVKLPDDGDAIRLPGNRWLSPGQTVLVPKTAIRFPQARADDERAENGDLFGDVAPTLSTRIRD